MPELCDVGIVGLSASAQSAALGLSEKGFEVAVLSENHGFGRPAESLSQLVGMLRLPRAILIFDDQCQSLNATIDGLAPLLGRRDLIVDCGDSHFKETAARSQRLAEQGLQLMALGVGGFGWKGAGTGAVLMLGGPRDAYERTLPLWETWAAKINGVACAGYFGPAPAAHFVKMVHRAIDLGLMQLLRETLQLARHLPDLGFASSVPVQTRLRAFLEEIFGDVGDEEQIDKQLSIAKASCYARWFTQAGRDLGVPTPTIDVALGTQMCSARERQQELIATPFRQPMGRFGNDSSSVTGELETAFHTAMIITYAEGLALLAAASERFGFGLDLAEIARVWRGCCTVRAPLFSEIAAAFHLTPNLPNLLLDDDVAEEVMAGQELLRHAVCRAADMEIETPGLLASLDYFDNHREAWLPINLIQPLPEMTNDGARMTQFE